MERGALIKTRVEEVPSAMVREAPERPENLATNAEGSAPSSEKAAGRSASWTMLCSTWNGTPMFHVKQE
jgi:hypothetical protein